MVGCSLGKALLVLHIKLPANFTTNLPMQLWASKVALLKQTQIDKNGTFLLAESKCVASATNLSPAHK